MRYVKIITIRSLLGDYKNVDRADFEKNYSCYNYFPYRIRNEGF